MSKLPRRVVTAVTGAADENISAKTMVPDPRPPEFSDDALALRFAEQHELDLRFVAAFNRWFIWEGTRWAPDDTLRGFDDARKVCRLASSECNENKLRKVLASAATVAAVERLARADRRLAATATQWDCDPWLLNTPDGIIDLQTGLLRRAHREDYVTKITRAGPRGKCPTWLAFLDRVTDGDKELQAFIARMIGYCLTGITREHALFFNFGLGSNGKTTLIETIAGMLGDYAVPAPIDMFTASKFEKHSTDVAGLQGARFVTASETEQGRPWAEARIKLLTGGEEISARLMRKDNIRFLPHFKLIVTGNHKPRLSSQDEAIRRRLYLIPFNVTIDRAERDQRLPERLKAEWPGIMSWALEGCLDWQRNGLKPPATVRDATEDYLIAEDTFGSWLAEQTEADPNAVVSTIELFEPWKAYQAECGERVGTQKDFVEALAARGFVHRHTREGNRWFGIRAIRKMK